MRLQQKISDRRGFATTTAGSAGRCAAGLLLALLAGAPLSAAGAAQDDLFTVENVAVDATEETAATAREVALAEGYRKAFRRVVARMVPRDRQGEVPALSPERLAALVRNFEVSEEKTSTVRYLAELTIRFNGAAVRTFLREAGVPYAETQSKPLLVLPVLSRAGANVLWDNPNPWREAWSATPPDSGLVPLVAPRGGLEDLSIISAEQAMRGERERIDAIARRYDADGALIAIAEPSYGTEQRIREMEVIVRRSDDAEGRTWRNTIRSQGNETAEELFARAARETASFVREQWKSEYLLRFDQQHELVVTVPLRSLDDWVILRRRLADIAFVSGSDLVALSRHSATVRLRYVGGEEQLRTALAQSDLALVEGSETPVLRFRGRDGAGAGFGTGGQ